MKLMAFVVFLIALLGLMVYTNPSMNDFSNYVRQSVIQESQKEAPDSLGQALTSILGGLAGGLVTTQTIRNDYIFFSTYELAFGKERLRAIGVFRNFFLQEKPEILRHKTGKQTE